VAELPVRLLRPGNLPLEPLRIERRDWVVMRPTSRRLRRRKAVSEASLPGSGHSSSSADDRHLPFTTPGPPPAG